MKYTTMKYITMLPFLSNADLKELAYKVINEEVKGVKLAVLFPFLDEETLDEIVERLIQEKRGRELTYALPFVSRDVVTKLYEAIEKEDFPGLRKETLLPFLDKEQIKRMFEEILKNVKDEPEDDEDEDDE